MNTIGDMLMNSIDQQTTIEQLRQKIDLLDKRVATLEQGTKPPAATTIDEGWIQYPTQAGDYWMLCHPNQEPVKVRLEWDTQDNGHLHVAFPDGKTIRQSIRQSHNMWFKPRPKTEWRWEPNPAITGLYWLDGHGLVSVTVTPGLVTCVSYDGVCFVVDPKSTQLFYGPLTKPAMPQPCKKN